MTIKLQNLSFLLSLSLIASGCATHLYYPDSVVHQNIAAATTLSTGMGTNEVRNIMGAEPIRVDTEGDTTVWQYCDTQYDQSNYVALFFAHNSNSLGKIDYYPITWSESRGEYLFPSDHGQAEIHTENLQISCEHFAQKMGIKDPGEIYIGGYSEQELDDNRIRTRKMVNKIVSQNKHAMASAFGGSEGCTYEE